MLENLRLNDPMEMSWNPQVDQQFGDVWKSVFVAVETAQTVIDQQSRRESPPHLNIVHKRSQNQQKVGDGIREDTVKDRS